MGILYICPTPIGNLDDITLRTLKTLEEVDLIAAEDTRRSVKLLNYYDIKKPLTSYYEHNMYEKGPILIGKLQEGLSIALVSDAGMPGISDPGEELIKQALEEGIEVIALPGATASITALVISGLSTKNFIFEGFLPPKKGERKEELKRIAGNKYTSIIYESPYRLVESLELMEEIFPDRQISVSRELTKKYEETLRGCPGQLLGKIDRKQVRGEFVIIIDGNTEEEEQEELDLDQLLKSYMDQGYSKSKAVKKVSQEYGIPKNTLYKKSIDM